MVDLERLSPALDAPSDRSERCLPISVVATTSDGTRAALAAATTCASGLGAALTLLVPHVVPYALPIEHPAVTPVAVGQRFHTMATALGIDLTIRVCLCRFAPDVASLVPRDGLVLVGGRRRWWRSREERLADALVRAGVRVLFVHAYDSPTRPRSVA